MQTCTIKRSTSHLFNGYKDTTCRRNGITRLNPSHETNAETVVISQVKHKPREEQIYFESISFYEKHFVFAVLAIGHTGLQSLPAFSDSLFFLFANLDLFSTTENDAYCRVCPSKNHKRS